MIFPWLFLFSFLFFIFYFFIFAATPCLSLLFVHLLVLAWGPCQTDGSGPLAFPEGILHKHPHTSLSPCPTFMWEHCHDRIHILYLELSGKE